MSRDINGEFIPAASNYNGSDPVVKNYAGAFYKGSNILASGVTAAPSQNSISARFLSGLVVPTGPEGSVRTIADRFWRRVA